LCDYKSYSIVFVTLRDLDILWLFFATKTQRTPKLHQEEYKTITSSEL